MKTASLLILWTLLLEIVSSTAAEINNANAVDEDLPQDVELNFQNEQELMMILKNSLMAIDGLTNFTLGFLSHYYKRVECLRHFVMEFFTKDSQCNVMILKDKIKDFKEIKTEEKIFNENWNTAQCWNDKNWNIASFEEDVKNRLLIIGDLTSRLKSESNEERIEQIKDAIDVQETRMGMEQEQLDNAKAIDCKKQKKTSFLVKLKKSTKSTMQVMKYIVGPCMKNLFKIWLQQGVKDIVGFVIGKGVTAWLKLAVKVMTAATLPILFAGIQIATFIIKMGVTIFKLVKAAKKKDKMKTVFYYGQWIGHIVGIATDAISRRRW